MEDQWKGTQKPRLLTDEEFKKAWRDINYKWNKKKINNLDDKYDRSKEFDIVMGMEEAFEEHAKLTQDKKINLLDLQRTVQTMMF